MPQDGGTSNRKENKTEVNKELNARLPKYSPDQALLFTARSPIHVGMPPLISYIRRQFYHLGESSRRLTGWVTGHGSLASTVSRATRLPLLSRAFDYIRERTTFVSPVWQRMLDLPWVRQHRRRRRDSNQATGITIDGRLNKTSPQQSEIYPDVLLQPLGDIQGEQAGSEAGETYTLAVDETYPSIISPNLLSPPVTRRELLTTTDDLPHAAIDTTWPLHMRKIADRQYPSVPSKPSYVTTKEKPLRAGDEFYPSVTKTKDVFSAPVSMEKAPGTISPTFGTKPMTGRHYLSRSIQPLPITSGEAPVRSGDEVYPSVTKDVFSAPVSLEKAPGTTSLTPVTKPMTGRHYLSRSSQPSPITRGEAPVRSGDEFYPAVTKDVFSAPLSMKKAPGTTSLTPIMKPMTGRHYLSRSSQPSPITRGEAPVRSGDEVYPSVTKDVFSAPVATERVSRTTSLAPGTKPISKKQPLSQAVTEVQPLALQSKPVKGRSHITRREIDGTHVFPQRKLLEPKTVELKVESEKMAIKQPDLPFLTTMPKTGASDKPTVQTTRTPLTPAVSKQPSTLKHKSSIETFLGRSGPTILRDTLDRFGPSIIPRMAKYLNEPLYEPPSKALPPEKQTYSDGSEVLPSRASQQWTPQAGQARRQKPVVSPLTEPAVSPSVEPADEQASVIFQAEGMTDISQRSDTLYPISLEHGGIGRSSIKGRVNKPLLYREPLSFASPPVPELPVPEIADHAMNLPSQQLFKSGAHAPLSDRSENSRFLWGQKYVPYSPGYEYASQPALELPVASPIQRKAKPGTDYSEELFKDISYTTTKPELTYSKNQNVPELALARVSRQIETTSQPNAPERRGEDHGGEDHGEEAATPDIDAIARDVYRILRRRLVRERERTLGVH